MKKGSDICEKQKKGFTLIEIIVVLAIIGILIAIAVPAVLGYVKKAEDQRFLAHARGNFAEIQEYVSLKVPLYQNTEDFQTFEKNVKDELKILYQNTLGNRIYVTGVYDNYTIQNMVVYFDDIADDNNKTKLDFQLKTHYVSKIGIMYGDTKINKSVVVVFRVNEGVKVFYDFYAMVADKEWACDFLGTV